MSTPKNASPARLDSFPRSARCWSASSAVVWWTSGALTILTTTLCSRGGLPGATCASATSAGASITSLRAQHWPRARPHVRWSVMWEPATTRRSSPSSNRITYNDRPITYSMSSVLDRFLRYVRYDTQSDERSTTCPSTDKQLILLRDLVTELKDFGLADASIDAHGYVMATIPARRATHDVPTIGFIAHADTPPERSAA